MWEEYARFSFSTLDCWLAPLWVWIKKLSFMHLVKLLFLHTWWSYSSPTLTLLLAVNHPPSIHAHTHAHTHSSGSTTSTLVQTWSPTATTSKAAVTSLPSIMTPPVSVHLLFTGSHHVPRPALNPGNNTTWQILQPQALPCSLVPDSTWELGATIHDRLYNPRPCPVTSFPDSYFSSLEPGNWEQGVMQAVWNGLCVIFITGHTPSC